MIKQIKPPNPPELQKKLEEMWRLIEDGRKMYKIVNNPNGSYTIFVMPPRMFNLPPTELRLSAAQYSRFEKWLAGDDLIQNLLPDLTAAEREILLTGLNDETFQRFTKESED